MKIAVTGSSGLIGTALTASLPAGGHQVRRPARPGGGRRWEGFGWVPRAANAGAPPLSGVDAVVHLAGAGVGDHRWTASYKAEIRASRVLATTALATVLAGLPAPPKTLVAGSA